MDRRPTASFRENVTMTWPAPPDVKWSTRVQEADWIGERLRPPEDFCVGSIVPQGFPAYARVLHPARGPNDRPVRWGDAAAWSGRTLRPATEFDAIAIPEVKPDEPMPWRHGPRNGSLDSDDARALIAILARHTASPETCWFCIWAGYGWSYGSGRSVAMLARSGGPSVPDPEPRPDPIPRHVRDGPLVDLPWREYYLYTGPIIDALAFVPTQRQTANLFWPSDRIWCAASEIDLPWTYVGGSEALVEEILASPDIEAMATDTGVRHGQHEPWILDLAEGCADRLIATGSCTIETTVGTVTASLERSGLRGRQLELVTWHGAETGTGGGGRTPLGRQGVAEAREEIVWRLISAIRALVE
jgi:hypothetical protein